MHPVTSGPIPRGKFVSRTSPGRRIRSYIRVRDHLVITFISDTHLLHEELSSMPPGDILVHCGDWSFMGTGDIAEFDAWMGELPYDFRLLVPGNHDLALANGSKLHNAIVLINEGVELAGLKFWGSPVTSVGPAFGFRSAERRRRIFSTIPDDTDVLITHAAPLGALDDGCGDPELRAAIDRVEPMIAAFGHIHAGPATATLGETLFVNASVFGPYGTLRGQPVVLKLPRRSVVT